MVLRLVRRFADPPKCLEIDTIEDKAEHTIQLLRGEGLREGIKPVYVIRQYGAGRGLFSIVSSVVCHLHVAEKFGLTPYVDLSSCHSEYKDSEFEASDTHSRTNPWEYYFQQVSDLTAEEAYGSSLVLASSLGFPDGYLRKMLISHAQSLRDIASYRIKPAVDLEATINEHARIVFDNHNVLGVHFRGQEQKVMPYHPLSPTESQIFMAIDMAIKEQGFDRIYVASEDLDSVDLLRNRYGKMVFSLPHYRTRSPVNAYRINPRSMHKYLLGKEILIDTMLLSRCHGLVSSTSNVTEAARAINNGRFIVDIVIDNGLNARNPMIAKRLWYIKEALPARFGGFSSAAIKHFPKINNQNDY